MKSTPLLVALFASCVLGIAVPKPSEKVTASEDEDARDKLIFLAEKLLVLSQECLSFKEVHWNLEANNHFADTLNSLEAVNANPTLVADLRVRAAAEKQQVMDKLTTLDTSFAGLRTQILKIAEKLRQEIYNEISEHFVQFKVISGEISTKYSDFQSTLSFVINDLELATLLAINGISHPSIPDVHTNLQESKDAANNANEDILSAQQLFENARAQAETAVDVIVNQTRRQKTAVAVGHRFRGEAQPADVARAQLDVRTWIDHLIILNGHLTRLQNAMRLQLSDAFLDIFKAMRELQVEEATVAAIETDNRVDGQLLELSINSLWSTMKAAFPALNSVNSELNSIDKNTRDALRDLLNRLKDTDVAAINRDFDTVYSIIDSNLPLTLDAIKNAITGMSGDPVIRIYLGLQEVESTFDDSRRDVMSEKVIYDATVADTLSVVQKIIDDLCSGLFC